MVDKVVSVGKPICHVVLPIVYDDALSYYETICKYTEKLNEVIDLCNSLSDEILAQAYAYTDTKIAETFEEVNRKIAELQQLIRDTTEYFDLLVEQTVERFQGLIDDLQAQYQRFTQYVNAQLDAMGRRVDTLDTKIDTTATALRSEMDLKIQLNNEYILDEVQNNLPSIMKVWNILEGTQLTIQEMFNYLCYLHIVDGIDVQTLGNRQLTCTYIAGLNRTVRDCVMYGNTILQ